MQEGLCLLHLPTLRSPSSQLPATDKPGNLQEVLPYTHSALGFWKTPLYLYAALHTVSSRYFFIQPGSRRFLRVALFSLNPGPGSTEPCSYLGRTCIALQAHACLHALDLSTALPGLFVVLALRASAFYHFARAKLLPHQAYSGPVTVQLVADLSCILLCSCDLAMT